MTETKLYFEDVEVGDEVETPGQTVTETDLIRYVGLTGEWDERFIDAEPARGSAGGLRDVPDLLILCISSGLTWRAPRPPLATLALTGFEWQFLQPLLVGDTIRNRCRAVAKRSLKDNGLVVEEREVVNQRNELVQLGRITFLVEKRRR